jgi:hypothetical protein
VRDPLVGFIRNTHQLVALAESNKARLALVDLAEARHGGWALEKVAANVIATRFNLERLRGEILDAMTDGKSQDEADAIEAQMDAVDLDMLVTLFAPALMPHGDTGIVTVIRDGKREWYEVHDIGLWEALTEARRGAGAQTIIGKLFFGLAHLLRTTATAPLSFTQRNIIRDTLDAKTKAQYNHRWIDTFKAAGFIIRNDESWQLFRASRAGQATLVASDRDYAREQLRRLGRSKLRTILDYTVLHPFDGLRALGELSENSTRLQAFRKSGGLEYTEDGQMRGSVAARESTQDFSKLGSTVRRVNRYVAFFGPMVGGWTRIGQQLREHPGQYAWRAFKIGILPGLLLWAINHDDERYKELPPWAKRAFWHVPIPGMPGHFVWIPRPFDLDHVGHALESYLSWAVDNDKAALNRLPFRNKKDAWELLTQLIPTGALSPLEAFYNYSAHFRRHIVSPFDTKLELDLQYNRWTSEFSKRVGPKIGLAPAQLDHIIYGYTSGIGREALAVLDVALGKNAPARPISQWPLIGGIVRGETAISGNSASVGEFYDRLEELEGKKASARRYAQAGDLARARSLVADYPNLQGELKRLHKARERMTDLRHGIDAIYRAGPDKMTPAQKRERLDEAWFTITQVARLALGKQPLPPRNAASPLPTVKQLGEQLQGAATAPKVMRQTEDFARYRGNADGTWQERAVLPDEILALKRAPGTKAALEEIRDYFKAGNSTNDLFREVMGQYRAEGTEFDVPPVIQPSVFQPDPLVIGSPWLAKLARTIIDLDPVAKESISKVTLGPTRASIDETLEQFPSGRLGNDGWGHLPGNNLLGVYARRVEQDIALNPRLLEDTDKLFDVLVHEVAHAAGHDEAGADGVERVLWKKQRHPFKTSPIPGAAVR